MNRYLKSLEVWSNDWRMSISANKCSFTIYSRKIPKILTKLEIYGQPIPINHSPRYLGVLIDNHLNLCSNNYFIIRNYSVEKLSGIQYQALKIISKERDQVSNTFFHDLYLVYKPSIKDYMNYQANT